jgi:spermidine synthase
MKPWKTLATQGAWTLRQRGEEFLVQVDGHVLMNSRRHGSEEGLARIGCARIVTPAPSVLVGGLGFGFTLRAALDGLGPSASVVVSELSEAVVQWNREAVAALAGRPVEDPRVKVETGEIQRLFRRSRARFDVILLDVDNGPFGLMTGNESLYGLVGLSTMRAALRPGGRLAIWSAGPQGGFLTQLREAGFRPSVEKPGDGKHLIFIGDTEHRRDD